MVTLTNSSQGARGVNLANGTTIWIEPGETMTIDAEVAANGIHADFRDALDHDGDGGKGGSTPHNPPALTGKTKAELLEIAAEEGAIVEDGMTNSHIVEAIEAARTVPV